MTEHRWSKFWWADHESDDALKLVSLAAQGLWVRMLCAMHRATPHGHMAVNGSAPTARQMAVMLCASEREIAKLLPELEAAGVFSRTPDGLIFSRRLVRDDYIKNKAIADGKKGGNPVLKRETSTEGLTPPLKAGVGATLKLEAEAEAEKEVSSLRSERARAEEANPRPDGWDGQWRETRASNTNPRAVGDNPRNLGCRLPAGWVPTDPTFEGATPQTLATFRDYWAAQPGAKGRKADWEATWRNWCRRDSENRKRAPPKTSALTTTDQNDELIRLARETELPQMRLIG